MKKISLLVLAFTMMAGLKAQTVQETTIQYGDFTVPAFTLSVPQDKVTVSDALNQRLKESSVKATKTNGYTAVLNQTFDAIYAQPVDFYAKIEEQGKKKDRVTVITFFAKSPNLTISQNELNNNVRTFAENFPRYINKYEAQMKVSAGQKDLEKAQKNQAKAAAAVAKIEKAIASDQEKVAKKQAEIAKYQEKIEACNKDIEKLNSNIEKNKAKMNDAQDKANAADDAVRSSEKDLNRYQDQVGN